MKLEIIDTSEIDSHYRFGVRIPFDLPDLPYNKTPRAEITEWCNDTFGNMFDDEFDYRWRRWGSFFFFRDEVDRNWFILRWS